VLAWLIISLPESALFPISGWKLDDIGTLFLCYYALMLPLPLTLVFRNDQFKPPFVFLPIGGGMLFGGALFPYDTFRGVHTTAEPNGFELRVSADGASAYFYGDAVAHGHMTAAEYKRLRDTISDLENA